MAPTTASTRYACGKPFKKILRFRIALQEIDPPVWRLLEVPGCCSVELEAIEPREAGVDYPRCIAGERAGPPDDCGGPGGYADLLKAIRSPRRKDHRDKVAWLGMMKGPGFDPDAFDPGAVRFDEPDLRRRVAFEGAKMTPDLRCWEFFRQGR